MSETTPDPADVHTGTDRGGCTCGEGDAVGDTTPGPCFVDASGFTVHRPPDLTDEEHHRRLWRDLADKDIQYGVDWPGVVRVLFADIDALTAGVEFHTGTDRVELTDAERAQRLLTGIRERDDDAAALRFINGWMQALTAERDRLRVDTNINADEVERQRRLLDLARAELAAANARYAELEEDFEDEYNRAVAFMVERDDWEREANRAAARLSELVQEKVQAQVANLRAALTPEGKPMCGTCGHPKHKAECYDCIRYDLREVCGTPEGKP